MSQFEQDMKDSGPLAIAIAELIDLHQARPGVAMCGLMIAASGIASITSNEKEAARMGAELLLALSDELHPPH